MNALDIKILQEIIDKEKVTPRESHLKRACQLLSNIREDAYMALSNTWDRSDSGFKAQIDLIEELFKEIGYNYES